MASQSDGVEIMTHTDGTTSTTADGPGTAAKRKRAGKRVAQASARVGDGSFAELAMPSRKHPSPDTVNEHGLIDIAGSRMFPCTIKGCPHSFHRQEHLKRHLRRHTGERPFECDVVGCGKRFSRYDNMRQHQLSHFERASRRRARAEREARKLSNQPAGDVSLSDSSEASSWRSAMNASPMDQLSYAAEASGNPYAIVGDHSVRDANGGQPMWLPFNASAWMAGVTPLPNGPAPSIPCANAVPRMWPAQGQVLYYPAFPAPGGGEDASLATPPSVASPGLAQHPTSGGSHAMQPAGPAFVAPATICDLPNSADVSRPAPADEAMWAACQTFQQMLQNDRLILERFVVWIPPSTGDAPRDASST